MISIAKIVNSFFESTKQIYIGVGISLFVIIIFMIMPINIYKPYLRVVKLIIIVGLAYLLYKNTIETQKLLSNIKTSLNDKQNEPIKNTIILSYTLSLVIFILLVYVFYGIFN